MSLKRQNISRGLLKPKNRAAKNSRSRFYVGLVAVAVGFLVSSGLLLNTWLGERSAAPPLKNFLSDNHPIVNNSMTITGTPVHLTVQNVGIDLSVIPGYYNSKNQSWTLSLNDAQYAVMTAKPNNKSGDTFIYAHYRLHVFYTLPRVKTGDQAVITTDNGHKFTYSFVSSTITTPDNTSLFNYRGKPVLILQTCTGLWYQNRQLFLFNLQKVS